MLIKNIQLKNFRNLQIPTQLDWSSNVNILVGNNAQGKSNLLEAIYFLSTGKSFRTGNDAELIHWNKSRAYLKATLYNKHHQFQLESNLFKQSHKEFLLNQNKVSKIQEATKYFTTVLFAPEDLSLVKGGPAERRKFLNNEISQVSVRYADQLKKYRKILAHRNNNLKNNIFGSQQEVWNEQLIKTGSYIIKRRLETVEKLKPLSRLLSRKITAGRENLEIQYLSTVGTLDKSCSIQDIEVMFAEALQRTRNEEKLKRITLVGPHRDDLLIKVNGLNIRSFGSQGQQRTASLALKLAEIEFIKSETGEYPVLLLDDVFSELDNSRKKYLVNTVMDKIQTFITSTELSGINGELTDNAKVFRVESGNITKL